MKPKFVSAFAKSMLPAAFWMVVSAAAHADTLTWDAGTNTNWNTSEDNWTTAATWSNGTPDSAIFGSTGVGTVTLTEGITVQNITFDAAGYTVAGNTLTVGTAGDTFITTNENATISSLIVGGSGILRKHGAATLTLTGANTYGGGTVLESGTLEVNSMADGTGSVGSGWVAMDNDSTLRYTGTGAESTTRDFWINNNAGTRTFDIVDAGASLTLSGGGGDISRTIRKAGVGTLVIGKVVAGGDATIIDAGLLEVSISGKLYGGGYVTSPVITINSGGTMRLNGWSWDAAGSIAQLGYGRDRLIVDGGTIEYAGSSNEDLLDEGTASRNFTVGMGGATLKASSPSGQTWTISVGSSGSILNDQGLTLDGAGNGAICKVIEGTGTLTKTGPGTWTLSGMNSYTGNTNVSEGILALQTASLADTSSVNIADDAKMALDFSGDDTVASVKLGATTYTAPGSYNATTYPAFFTGGGSLVIPSALSDYDSWELFYSLPADSEDVDTDNDGYTNREEYAFGLNPNNGASANPITSPLNKSSGQFSYQRRDNGLTALTYTVWYSTDLSAWTKDAGASQTDGTPDGDGVETINVTLTPALLTHPKLFIQVHAE